MHLNDSILWAMDAEGASGLIIRCDESRKEEVADFFEKTFTKQWEKAMDAVEEEYGDCFEKDEECGIPIEVNVAADCIRVTFEPIYLSFNYGDSVDLEYASIALEKTLKKFRKKYPDASYEGYIGFRWSDTKSGDTVQYEMISEDPHCDRTDRTYDFVGMAISASMVTEGDDFWEEMQEQLWDADEDDFKEILCNFHTFKEYLPDDAVDRLLDIADEIDEEIRPVLEEMIEAWENGEEVELSKDEPDTGNLPDGYMEALDAAVKMLDSRLDEDDDDEEEEE